MRWTGGWGHGVALAMLAACSNDAVPSRLATVTVEAPAGGAAAQVAAGDFVRGQADVREAVTPSAASAADFATLWSRWHDDPAAIREAVFTRADVERLFNRRRIRFNEYGASHLFADFNGDGSDEVVIAIGKGWWEDGFELCTLAPTASGYRLVCTQRIDAGGRYPPGLRQLAGDRPQFFCAARTSGTGTGICVGHQRLFEMVAGRPVEVLALLDNAEYAPYGIGPSFAVSTSQFEVVRDPASRGVVARSTLFVRVFDDFGDDFGNCDLEFELEFRQGMAGGRLLLQCPIGWRSEDLVLGQLTAIGIRAWFERHERAALRVAETGSARQQTFLRRAVAVAHGRGAHRVADAVLALLPEEPANGR